jgi:hypothetical protein
MLNVFRVASLVSLLVLRLSRTDVDSGVADCIGTATRWHGRSRCRLFCFFADTMPIK